MLLTIRKLSPDEILLYVSFTIYFVLSFLSTTFYFHYIPDSMYKAGLVLSVVLVLLRELIVSKYTVQSILSAALTLISVLIIMRVTSNLNLAALGLVFIYCFRNVTFTKIAKLSLLLSILLLAFVVLSSKVGIIRDHLELTAGGRIRHYLGFRYSLFAPSAMVNIITLYLFLYKEKIPYITLILLSIFNFWIFDETSSRLTFFTGVLLLIFALFNKLYPQVLPKLKGFLAGFSLTFIFSALISYFVSTRYSVSNALLFTINSFLGNRIYLANLSLHKYGFNLLGQKVFWVGNGLDPQGNYTTITYLYVDNLYIQMLQRYGLLFLILFVILATLVMFRLLRKNELVTFIIFISLGLHALIDDLILYLYFNSFWFVFAILMNNNYRLYSDEDDRIFSLNKRMFKGKF